MSLRDQLPLINNYLTFLIKVHISWSETPNFFISRRLSISWNSAQSDKAYLYSRPHDSVLTVWWCKCLIVDLWWKWVWAWHGQSMALPRQHMALETGPGTWSDVDVIRTGFVSESAALCVWGLMTPLLIPTPCVREGGDGQKVLRVFRSKLNSWTCAGCSPGPFQYRARSSTRVRCQPSAPQHSGVRSEGVSLWKACW